MAINTYGLTGFSDLSPIEIELGAFLLDPPAGLGKSEHFWNIVSMLWPPSNKAKKLKHFERNPWTERMVEAACENQYVALSGCAASGKTDFAAVWAIVNWLCAPYKTLVFCTSTSLKDSNRRIWGRIKAFWQAAPKLPGKLVDSMYTIRTDNGSGVFSDEQGICCLAGEKKDEKEAVGKLIGAHPDRLILIIDEMPEITEAILTAALSNMAINPYFQLIGIGNFKSLYDTFGVFAQPKVGYGSVNVKDEEWDTKLGVCLRFDGMKSPNITGGEDRYECYNSKNLATHRKNYGEDSIEFWRMCRSFPSPEGSAGCLYSEADFIAGKVDEEVVWLEAPKVVMAADPSFTNDGDKFEVVKGLYGMSSLGFPVLKITGHQRLIENIELSRTGEPRDIQMARQLQELAQSLKCYPENCGIDCSGPGGLAFGSIVSAVWSNRFHAAKFGESASTRPVTEDDPKTCQESFANKVTELWAIGRHFLRSGQLKGIDRDIANDLKARMYETIKGVSMKIVVEPKKKMKVRIGRSPDLGDATMILVDLCRERFGFTPGSAYGVPQLSQRNTDLLDRANAAHSIYDPKLSYVEAA